MRWETEEAHPPPGQMLLNSGGARRVLGLHLWVAPGPAWGSRHEYFPFLHQACSQLQHSGKPLQGYGLFLSAAKRGSSVTPILSGAGGSQPGPFLFLGAGTGATDVAMVSGF